MLRRIVKWNRNAAKWLEEKYPKFFSGPSYKTELDDRIAREIEATKPQTILEVGGIDRPLLSRGNGYVYIGLDIDEQPTCYEIYDQFIVRSIEEPLDLNADMIVSITLLEHVPNNSAAIRTMYALPALKMAPLFYCAQTCWAQVTKAPYRDFATRCGRCYWLSGIF
jgi:hypothetical protein